MLKYYLKSVQYRSRYFEYLDLHLLVLMKLLLLNILSGLLFIKLKFNILFYIEMLKYYLKSVQYFDRYLVY